MILSYFLSRQQGDDSNPHQIISISFNIREILKLKLPQLCKTHFWYKLANGLPTVHSTTNPGSQNKAKGVKLPMVHGTTKPLVLHGIPEK